MNGDTGVHAIARRCLVSGRVQGVNYRASAQRRALAAGITGCARNLPDGRVEVIAWGSSHAVHAFIDWLWVGPAAAKVFTVQVESLEPPSAERPSDFTTA